MTDALARPTSVLLVGGTSDIAIATLHALRSPILRRVVIAARPSAGRDEVIADLTRAGYANVEVVDFDAADTSSHEQMLDE